jgi:hypothetical protein
MMKTVRAVLWMSAAAAVSGVLGCEFSLFSRGSAPHASVNVGQREPDYVIVREAPPPALRERRPAPPSREYLWIDGYWAWNGREYVWEPGRWAVPPRERAVWVAPRYEKDDHGYRYRPGHWKEQDRR